MALFTGGMFLGMALTAVVKIPPSLRFFLFQVCGITSFACMIVFPFMGSFPVAVSLLAVSGFANAVLNVFIMSVMQLAVPQNMRGKVFSLMGMVTQGLTPVAFALAGVLAEFIPIAFLMGACFAVTIVVGLPFIFLTSFKQFIGFDPARDTVQSIS